MVIYRPRVVDALLADRLTSAGAVLIEGPKEAAGIDPTRRAETLSLTEFAALSNMFAQGKNA